MRYIRAHVKCGPSHSDQTARRGRHTFVLNNPACCMAQPATPAPKAHSTPWLPSLARRSRSAQTPCWRRSGQRTAEPRSTLAALACSQATRAIFRCLHSWPWPRGCGAFRDHVAVFGAVVVHCGDKLPIRISETLLRVTIVICNAAVFRA